MTTIIMARGTSREIIVPVTDENGVPLDLTNGTARFWVGKSVNSTGADVWLRKDTADNTITITSDGATPPLFSLNIAVNPSDTETVEPRDSYYYEASVADQAGNEYVVAGDAFELKPSLSAP